MQRLIGLLFIIGSFMGCAYDSEEDLFFQNECVQGVISYSAQIVPILQASCYGCHAIGINFGGVTIEGHGNLIPYVNNGRLLGAIQHENGFSKMPQGAPMLPNCQIMQIEAWIDDGARDN